MTVRASSLNKARLYIDATLDFRARFKLVSSIRYRTRPLTRILRRCLVCEISPPAISRARCGGSTRMIFRVAAGAISKNGY